MERSEAEGLFGPASVVWKVNREVILLLGARYMVLMQLAHPLVAAGVAEHSGYQNDLIGRFRRTVGSMLSIFFGDRAGAQATVDRINELHKRVKGTTEEGQRYYATDPKLLKWVYSTFVDGLVRVYESSVERLSEDEVAAYYEESKLMAQVFGVPEELLPETFGDLRAWMDEMVESGEVEVTPLARRLAEPILRPVPFMPRRLAVAGAAVTAALLPPSIRTGYGLKLGRPGSLLVALGGRACRTLIPKVPPALRTFPAARAAMRRAA